MAQELRGDLAGGSGFGSVMRVQMLALLCHPKVGCAGAASPKPALSCGLGQEALPLSSAPLPRVASVLLVSGPLPRSE